MGCGTGKIWTNFWSECTFRIGLISWNFYYNYSFAFPHSLLTSFPVQSFPLLLYLASISFLVTNPNPDLTLTSIPTQTLEHYFWLTLLMVRCFPILYHSLPLQPISSIYISFLLPFTLRFLPFPRAFYFLSSPSPLSWRLFCPDVSSPQKNYAD